MNTAETDLATKILNAAADTARCGKAGDTLLFVEAYDKLLKASIISYSVNPDPSEQKDEVVYKCDGSVNIVTKDCATAVLPDLGESTPIQPIPAPTKRNRRTQAQIEADNAAAAQVITPVEGNGSGETSSTDSVPATGASSGSPSQTEVAAPPGGIDGITLSTLFKTILSSKEEPDKTTFKNAVRAKLEAVGIPQISKLTPEHFESFNTFLLTFKA